MLFALAVVCKKDHRHLPTRPSASRGSGRKQWKKKPNENETKVTSRGQEWKGAKSPKTRSKSTETHFKGNFEVKRKLDDTGASEINRLYPESRSKDEKEYRYLNSLPPQGEAGGRKRPNENETGVTSRGREGKSAGREGLTAPKHVRGAPKMQWEKECCFFFAAGMKRKSLQVALTDATAGGTKLKPALTLIPVLMRSKCI
ncbi:hypothetical protein TNCV_1378421 [Trichonephila clavipes]|nr:hypothetical protein TNCV_1378421 [Trichonephila clavipes]